MMKFDQLWLLAEQGGWVLFMIFMVCIVLWTLIFERLWFFYRVWPAIHVQLITEWQHLPLIDNHWVMNSLCRARLSEQRLLALQGVSTITTLIAVCPLLGLLGTVTGMIQVFDVIAHTGTGNARAMANSISMATLPTMAGLAVALSGLFFRGHFQRVTETGTDNLQQVLMGACYGQAS